MSNLAEPSLRAILDALDLTEEMRKRIEELNALVPWGVPDYDLTEDQLEAKAMRNYLVDRAMDGEEV